MRQWLKNLSIPESLSGRRINCTHLRNGVAGGRGSCDYSYSPSPHARISPAGCSAEARSRRVAPEPWRSEGHLAAHEQSEGVSERCRFHLQDSARADGAVSKNDFSERVARIPATALSLKREWVAGAGLMNR